MPQTRAFLTVNPPALQSSKILTVLQTCIRTVDLLKQRCRSTYSLYSKPKIPNVSHQRFQRIPEDPKPKDPKKVKDRKIPTKRIVLQDPRFLLNFCISGLVSVECTEALYYGNPEIQNSAEFGDLAVCTLCVRIAVP